MRMSSHDGTAAGSQAEAASAELPPDGGEGSGTNRQLRDEEGE